MKSTLTTVPDMYADWMAMGWSMLLGKPPTGADMELKRNANRAAAEREPAHKGVSVMPAKKVRAKPAARKSRAKPAAGKSPAKPAAKHTRRAAPAKNRRASAKRR